MAFPITRDEVDRPSFAPKPSPRWQEGLAADRPDPSRRYAGLVYISIDTHEISRCDGAVWAPLTSPGNFTTHAPPTNGTSGTYAAVAEPGAILTDASSGTAYVNTGTKESPMWTGPSTGLKQVVTVADNQLYSGAGDIATLDLLGVTKVSISFRCISTDNNDNGTVNVAADFLLLDQETHVYDQQLGLNAGTSGAIDADSRTSGVPFTRYMRLSVTFSGQITSAVLSVEAYLFA